jgi:predicted nucleotide-binding protein
MPRARENVWFEVGYCFGKLNRKSGRVIIISVGDVKFPSDLHGVIYVDGNQDEEKVSEALLFHLGKIWTL